MNMEEIQPERLTYGQLTQYLLVRLCTKREQRRQASHRDRGIPCRLKREYSPHPTHGVAVQTYLGRYPIPRIATR